MPSLSRTSSGVDAVAERLLVAVDAGRRTRGDPLEAGERLLVPTSRWPRRSRPSSARRRSSRRRPRPRRRPRVAATCAPSRAPDLVAAQHPPAAAPSRTATAQRSASGSLAMTRSAPTSRASGEREVHGAGLLGVGEATRSGSRVGLGLLGDRRSGAGNPARVEHPARRCRRPTPCSARVHDGRSRGASGRDEAGGARRGRRRATSSPRVSHPSSARGTSRDRRDRGDVRRRSRRRPAARSATAVAEVDLVAVVLRRVVAGRDHDAGVGAEVADREREHRGRQRRGGRIARAPAAADDDVRGVAGEDVGVVPGVVADDDRSARRCRARPAGRPRGPRRPG